jgi:hypothetical protein
MYEKTQVKDNIQNNSTIHCEQCLTLATEKHNKHKPYFLFYHNFAHLFPYFCTY